MPFLSRRTEATQKIKKKPPPRPPPPNISKYRSKSTFNLNQQTDNLIDLSPPRSPKTQNTSNFGGSVSSSYSSSTSSLSSSKKSSEYEFPVTNNLWPINREATSNFKSYVRPRPSNNISNPATKNNFNSQITVYHASPDIFQDKQNAVSRLNIPTLFGPTIIRPQVTTTKNVRDQITVDNNSPPSPTLPMPCVPPPSPPKEVSNVNIAYGIALYDFEGTDPRDLSFQANDLVILLRKVNSEWYYGKVLDKEGMFPANFIDVQVPLIENDKTVMALYEFSPQMKGDLALKPGQLIKVIKKIDADWLYGESNGQCGQFPSNFIDRLPDL